jgi:hypothetical protein
VITWSRRKLAHESAMARHSYSFAGADDSATATIYPHWEVLPEVARSLLADGYPELSRHLTRHLD